MLLMGLMLQFENNLKNGAQNGAQNPRTATL